jgi:AcrR family transcriptional regulator
MDMTSSAHTSEAAPPIDRRSARRQATMAEIVEAAWELVRAEGLAGLAMRDLGRRVGMKAQSLYSYFGSKNDIYDAMFLEGYQAFAASAAESFDDDESSPVERVRAMASHFFDFCTSDPVRYQLLFQRTIPDFVPSDESFAVAVEVYESMSARLAALGVSDPAAIDLWTAVLTGLTDQQVSNDPGGDRWERLLDRAVDMLLREIAPHLLPDSRGSHQ